MATNPIILQALAQAAQMNQNRNTPNAPIAGANPNFDPAAYAQAVATGYPSLGQAAKSLGLIPAQVASNVGNLQPDWTNQVNQNFFNGTPIAGWTGPTGASKDYQKIGGNAPNAFFPTAGQQQPQQSQTPTPTGSGEDPGKTTGDAIIDPTKNQVNQPIGTNAAKGKRVFANIAGLWQSIPENSVPQGTPAYNQNGTPANMHAFNEMTGRQQQNPFAAFNWTQQNPPAPLSVAFGRRR